jgi:Flp pilus assembly protein TadB
VSTNLEVVKGALLDEQHEAELEFNRGVVTLVLVPIAVFAGLMLGIWLDSFLPLLVAALYTVVGGCFGVLWFFTGMVKQRRAERELRELEDSRLPKARLLT